MMPTLGPALLAKTIPVGLTGTANGTIAGFDAVFATQSLTPPVAATETVELDLPITLPAVPVGPASANTAQPLPASTAAPPAADLPPPGAGETDEIDRVPRRAEEDSPIADDTDGVEIVGGTTPVPPQPPMPTAALPVVPSAAVIFAAPIKPLVAAIEIGPQAPQPPTLQPSAPLPVTAARLSDFAKAERPKEGERRPSPRLPVALHGEANPPLSAEPRGGRADRYVAAAGPAIDPSASIVGPALPVRPVPDARLDTCPSLKPTTPHAAIRPDPVAPTAPVLRAAGPVRRPVVAALSDAAAMPATVPLAPIAYTSPDTSPSASIPASRAPLLEPVPQPTAHILDTGNGNLDLSTERLGAISVALEARETRVGVRFITDTPLTANLLSAAAPRLADALTATGGRLDALSVDVRGGGGGADQRAPAEPPRAPATVRIAPRAAAAAGRFA